MTIYRTKSGSSNDDIQNKSGSSNKDTYTGQDLVMTLYKIKSGISHGYTHTGQNLDFILTTYRTKSGFYIDDIQDKIWIK